MISGFANRLYKSNTVRCSGLHKFITFQCKRKNKYQSYKNISNQTDILNSQAGKETVDNNVRNIRELWSNEIIDETLLWTNTIQQQVEIVTAAVQQYKPLAAWLLNQNNYGN